MAKLYLEAGRVVEEVINGHVGLKTALYRWDLESDPRAVCKLAAATLGRREGLRSALQSVGLLDDDDKGGETAARKKRKKAEGDSEGARHPGVAMVMAYDLLLGRGLRGGGHLKRELTDRKSQLQAALEAKQADGADAGHGTDNAFAALPRYLRLNRLRLPSAKEAMAARKRLARDLRSRVRQEAKAGRAGAEMAAARVEVDSLVPDLLMLDARARPWLQGLTAVEDGSFVLQDRSSCLAALGAGLAPGDLVIDACAAPGSKTTHAVELLKGRGHVLAFERSPARAAALVARLEKISGAERFARKRQRPSEDAGEGGDQPLQADAADKGSIRSAPRVPRPGSVIRLQAGAVRVDVRVGDFLACNPAEPPFNRARVLIVDPSCSGSGLPEHHLLGGESSTTSQARLRKLAAFQKKILAHALRFPGAQTVVYSTCSTQREENEDVVAAVLREQPAPAFHVVEALPWWKNVAPPAGDRPLEDWASLCVRCSPDAHRCRGFFLCRLDRLPTDASPLPLTSAKGAPTPMRKKRRRSKRNSDGSGAGEVVPTLTPRAKKGRGRGLLIRLGR